MIEDKHIKLLFFVAAKLMYLASNEHKLQYLMDSVPALTPLLDRVSQLYPALTFAAPVYDPKKLRAVINTSIPGEPICIAYQSGHESAVEVRFRSFATRADHLVTSCEDLISALATEALKKGLVENPYDPTDDPSTKPISAIFARKDYRRNPRTLKTAEA